MSGKRRWLRWVGFVLLAVVAVVAVLVGRVLWQRSEHQKLREAEVGRAPVVAPKRSKDVVTKPVALSPDSTLCLQGQVLDHGVPLGGMQVSTPDAELTVAASCACRGCLCAEGLETLLANPRGGLLAPVKSATTKPDGTFALCGLERHDRLLVWGEHEDGRVALPTKELAEAKPGAWVPLEVLDLVPTSGLVVTKDGPVAGARVLAWARPPVFVREATTDAQGRFSMPLLAGSGVIFAVAAPKRQPVLLERSVEARALLVLELDDPFTLTVRALVKGQPVAGAEVQVGSEPARPTDAKGEVVVKGLAARDRVKVKVRKGELFANAAVWTTPGGAQRLDLALEPGVRLRGAIIDEKGQPRIGKVRGLGPPPLLETDAKGHFESEVLDPAADVYPEAVVEGCDAERATSREPGAGDVNVLLKVRCEPTVQGLVIDAEGAPIANALVELRAVKENETTGTDATGRFVLHQPEGSYRLKVSHERYRSAEQPLTIPTKEVTVVLDAGGSISGRVVDGAGKPIAGAEVAAMPGLLEDLLKEIEGGTSKATTDAQGHFMVTGLLAGRWVLAASGSSLPSTPSEVVVLQPAEHRQDVVITIDAKVDLTGVVLDERRQPIPAAEIRWDPEDEKAAMSSLLFDAVAGRMDAVVRFLPSPAATDADGRFELRGLPVSEVKLRVSAPRYADAEVKAARGAKLEVVLKREGGMVRGRVVDESGRPVARFQANGTDFTSEDGRFEVVAFQRDDSVRVTATGYAAGSKAVTMDAPEKDVGDITLRKGLSVRVAVTTEDKKPLDGVRVAASQPSGGDSCTTRQDGTCTLSSFVDEETLVKTRKTGFEVAEAKLEKGRFPEVLELTLKPAGGRVTGQVFGAPGRPAAARSVFLSSERASEFALTDAEGKFSVAGLSEGDYCASVELSGLLGTDWAAPLKVTPTPTPLVLGPITQGATLEIGAKLPGRVLVLQGTQPPMRAVDVAGDSANTLCTNLKVPVVTMVVTGAARIEGLPAGKWSVFVVAINESENEAPIPPKVVEVLPGETKRVP